MHNLIEDLLTFSKFSSNSHDASFETVKYSEVLEVVLQNLHQQIQDTNANIVLLNIPESGDGLKIKLMQLFQNLISNSLKFSKKDAPAVICIDSVDLGTHHQISVADNGIGIDKEYYNLIFETFKKLHNKQEYAGVGLGLSTCKKIVEQHDGKIWVESTPNEGTTFHFTVAKKH
jgi:light-regulated signal transduction histidine kinase (bacteriophytochrome)